MMALAVAAEEEKAVVEEEKAVEEAVGAQLLAMKRALQTLAQPQSLPLEIRQSQAPAVHTKSTIQLTAHPQRHD